MADEKPLFTKIAQGMPAGITSMNSQAARKWFQESVEKMKRVNLRKLFADSDSMVKGINISSIGSLFQFIYDPKWKAVLPYYDIHPLVFIVEIYPDGFSGINLHYISPYNRSRLMDALYEITLKEKDKMKVQISYQILKSAAKFRLFKPCYKRYLSTHVRSDFMLVEPKFWDLAVALPTQRFVKADSETVWAKSARMT